MDPSCLLSDEAFARRIAIGLMRDRDQAEDLVQEAWLQVLEKGASDVDRPRGYLAWLLRMISRKKRREEARRGVRERASARSESQSDTSALVARAEIHGLTVVAVLALDEPYRSTILRRFFEDRMPEEIAALEGIPVETVRTRLKRALAMLRARLEREGRDWREEWAVALTGASRWPEPDRVARAPLRSLGGAAGVAAVALVAWLAWPERPVGVEQLANAGGSQVGNALDGHRAELAPPATLGREPFMARAEEVRPPRGSFLKGRVRDEKGQPLSEVHVLVAVSRFDNALELSSATTDESGSFSCSLAGWSELSATARGLLGLHVEAWKRGHVPLRQDIEFTSDDQPVEPDLVLEPGRLLFGRVLGPANEPVAAALMTVRTRGDGARTRTYAGPTDRGGWFAYGLREGERVIEVLASSTAHGFANLAEGALPAGTTGDVVLDPIVLVRGRTLRGRCVHPDGTPVARLALELREVELAGGGPEPRAAELAGGLAQVRTVTDELGRFEVSGLTAGSFEVIDSTGPLGGRTWRPDGADVEIVIERHRLLVEVIDPTGRLLEAARIAVTRLSSLDEPVRTTRTLTMGNPPLAPATVVPGETVAVLAFAPGCAAVEERFVVAEDDYAPRLRLALAAEERVATLVLQPSAGTPGDWRVDLCAPLSGLLLPGFQDLLADAQGRVHGLPLGRYRVRIEPRDPTSSAERCALDERVPVDLSGGETPCSFAAWSSARLRILFTGAETDTAEPEPIADLEEYGASSELHAWTAPSMAAALASLELWPIGSEAAKPMRRLTSLRPKAGQFLDLVVPALPARLCLVVPGREPFERELHPVPGETLEVAVPCLEIAKPRHVTPIPPATSR